MAKKPAATKPASEASAKGAVTVKQIAERLDMAPKAVRSRIRRMHGGGAVVGRGKRYSWSGWGDPEVKRILAELKA